MNLKHLCLTLALILASSVGYAETRDIQTPIQNMFDGMGAPFTATDLGTPAAWIVPIYIDEGNSDGNAGSTDNPPLYTGIQTGDLMFVAIESHGDNAPTMAVAWTQVGCSPVTSTGDTELTVFYDIIESANPSRTITLNGGDHISHWTFGFRAGTFDADTPFEVDCGSADLGAGTALASDPIDTVSNGTFILTFFSSDLDASGGQWATTLTTDNATEVNVYTGVADLSVPYINGYLKNTGGGGGIQIQGVWLPATGTSGIVSGVADDSATHTTLTIGINGVDNS
jgi:hypothetical protein